MQVAWAQHENTCTHTHTHKFNFFLYLLWIEFYNYAGVMIFFQRDHVVFTWLKYLYILLNECIDHIEKWVKSFAIFWYMQVCGMYIMWVKQLELWEVLVEIGSIVVIAALICCALFYSACNLKATQMNA